MFTTSVAVCRLSRKELVSHKKHKNTAEHAMHPEMRIMVLFLGSESGTSLK